MQFNVQSDYQAPKRSAPDQMTPCTDCGGIMITRTSNSAKNPGRDYWACPNRCQNVFGGWVDEGPAFSKKSKWGNKRPAQQQRAPAPPADNDRLIRIEAKLDLLLSIVGAQQEEQGEE